MIRGEQLKYYIEECLQYDLRDVEQFYTKTKASRLTFTLDLEHQLNVAYSSSDLVAEILVSWLSLSETQTLLKKYLSEKLNDKVLNALPEGYFVEKKPKQFDIPLHPGSYKRRDLREYVAKSWQYLTGVSRPNFANPKKRPKNLPKQIPWKDPLSMSIPQLRLASQWLSYTIDGIAAQRISPDQFRDKGIDDSSKAEVIKGIKAVKTSDSLKLHPSKSEVSPFSDTIVPPMRVAPLTIDYSRLSNEGSRRGSCDVIRWDGTYPTFNLQSNPPDVEKGQKNARDFRPRSMSNIETRKLPRVAHETTTLSDEPYQPFRTLSFSSRNPKANPQTSPLAKQVGLQFVMKPVNHPTMQTLPFKVKPNNDASNGLKPSSNDSLEHGDVHRSSQYQFVQHQVLDRDVREQSMLPGHSIPGALPPTQATLLTPQPMYGPKFPSSQDPTIAPSSPPNNGGVKKDRKNSTSANSPKKRHKKIEDSQTSGKINLPPPTTDGSINRRLSLGAKANDNLSNTQFVFVSYPDRRGSVNSVSGLNNASNTGVATSTASNTSTSSFNSGSGPETRETPTGTPEPVHQVPSPSSKESPKSLTFHSFVPPNEGVATKPKAKKKAISRGKKRQFAFSEYMKSSPT